ncbi:MAG: hypothetical protein ABIO35_02525, partial [Nitrobacter sp.]
MRKLGVVVFGASTYDHHGGLNNPHFLNSANEFKKVMTDSKIVSNFDVTLLDLYDLPLSFSDTVKNIITFIKGNAHDDLIVYYCGHGDIGVRDDDYRVLLRSSDLTSRATLLEVILLIHDVSQLAYDKRCYFVLDACYSGSAIDQSERMDAGGADSIVNRRLSKAVMEAGRGVAVFSASGRHGVALAKRDDKFTLFTGTFLRCLKDGISAKKNLEFLSWLDLKDEIVHVTHKKLKGNAPIPRLNHITEQVSDITRVPFFPNRAYVPRSKVEGAIWPSPDQRVTEHLYWRGISQETPAEVLEDFLRQFPEGTFSALGRALLAAKIENFEESELEGHLLDHPRSVVLKRVNARLAKLNWERLKISNDLTELEHLIERFPEDVVAFAAKARADEVRARTAIAEPPAVGPPLEVFTGTGPDGLMSQPLPLVSSSPEEEPQRATSATESPITKLVRAVVSWIFSDRRIMAAVGVALLALGATSFALRSYYVSGLAVEEQRDAQAAVAAAEREAQFRSALAAAGNDVTKLGKVVEECKRASCAVLQEAGRRLQNARAAVAAEAQFRSDLAAAGNDVTTLGKVVDECRRASCAVLQEASRRLQDAQTVVAVADREAQFRSDLVTAGNDVTKLGKVVDECKRASCAALPEASGRLQDAQAAVAATERETQFRSDLAAAGNDVTKLSKVVDECRRASCVVLQEASRRLQVARAAVAAEAQFRSDLAAAGNDVRKLSKVVDECRRASCAVLQEASRRMQDAQTAVAATEREAQFRSDLAAAGNDVTKL